MPGLFPVSVNAVYRRPIPASIVRSTSREGFALVSTRLRTALEDVLPECCVDPIVDGDGATIPSHVTLFPKHTIRNRHYAGSTLRTCIECGRQRITYADRRPVYILKNDVRGRDCVMDEVGMIYVSERLTERFEGAGLRPLYLEEIEIKEHPLDGLQFVDA